ncbi:hypothetical protein AHAS_Ahas13G0395600 [Arachis hypogaea]
MYFQKWEILWGHRGNGADKAGSSIKEESRLYSIGWDKRRGDEVPLGPYSALKKMEVGSERERLWRSKRETSPERVKTWRLKGPGPGPSPRCSGSRKVQVVYYLSRNGLLEHPHLMELTLLPSQLPLRLKHVFDRLMALRGTAMPLQYSWSSKRKYKSGYVWHDLAPKDILHPSQGGEEEYVLKGSQLLQPSTERQGYAYDDVDDDEEEQGDKTSSTTTPHSRCSRGVSTEELLHINTSTVSAALGAAPVPGAATLAEKLNHQACGSSALESNVGTTKKRETVGKLQCEDKEYFSGSLLESIKAQAPSPSEPQLTRSNSYDEQRRSSRLGMEENEGGEGGGLIHKCIPRKKSSSK